MQPETSSRTSFVITGKLKKRGSGLSGILWQPRLFGLQGAQHQSHGTNDTSEHQRVCQLVYTDSDDAESLRTGPHLGCVIITKSSSVSYSKEDPATINIEHVAYAHKMSERSSVELRADSQVHCDEWFAAIATEIEALRGRNSPVPALPGASTLPSSTGSPGDAAASWNQPLRAFVELPCNAACADCGAAAPRWASVTHQVIICVECAGVHRNLGRHISFVQGLFNDTWSEENLAAFTSSPGNQLLNSRTLEYHVPQSVLKPNPQSSFEDKEKYITAKYKDKAFHPAAALPPQPPAVMPVTGGHRKISVGGIHYVGVLWVSVLSCHNLVNADVLSKSDPYVVVSVGSNNRAQSSPVINDNLNPVFNWKAGPFTWNGVAPVEVRVFDKDEIKDDSLGFVDVPLGEDDFSGGGTILRELTLHGVKHGSIKLSITYEKLD